MRMSTMSKIPIPEPNTPNTGDDNVHYQSFEALVNELIKHNKKFTMMSYPNRSHGIFEGTNTRRHLYELMTDYLKENLPPGPEEALPGSN